MADYASVLTGGSNNFATTSEHLNALATDILSEGVVGTLGNTSGVAPMTGGLAVNAQGTPDMTVAVTAGKAYVTTTPTSQGSQLLRANIATQNATIAANSTGGTRYDWIYVAMSASGAANPNADGTGVSSITVSRSTSSATDNGTPPTYGYPIAVVTVSNGASSITNGNITDLREAVTVANNSSDTGWITAEATPDTVTALGNRSYSLVFNSIDLTDTMSSGMRLKATRTSTAPTLSTSLNGSSQYYNKTSPNKSTFTDDFVCSAWIKITSYAASSIISRYNGTSGWDFGLDSKGRVTLTGFNAGAANYSLVKSYRSVPLNKWVHVAAQLDMSSFTNTSTTSYTMIDGIDCPALVTRAGTNPTALVQAGNLEVGSRNGGTQYFPGKLAQVAFYTAKVTQANVLATISQTLTGSETSLGSAYSFNNSITDLNTTTPNNLTAQGSAVATATDTPFAGGSVGTTEYGVITAASFSTNTTLTVLVPEGYAIPTTGGVSALSYSTHKVPYGFPVQRDRWRITSLIRTNDTQSSPVSGTWYNISPTSGTSGGQQINIPIGEWIYGYETNIYSGRVGSSNGNGAFSTLSTGAATESDTDMTGRVYIAANTAVDSALNGFVARQKGLSLSAATVYYLNYKTTTGSMNSIESNNGNAGDTKIFAECAFI